MRRDVILLILAIALPARAAVGQVVHEMTPEAIREAINSTGPDRYALMSPDEVGFLSTPFARVVGEAQRARKRYKPFAVSDVNPALVQPELWVVALGAQGAIPTAIVILPKGESDPGKAIQPTMTDQISATVMSARFPLSALKDGHEVHLVFSAGRCGVDRGVSDCVFPLDPKAIR